MNSKITFKFDNTEKVLFKYYTGEINLQDIKLSWDEMFDSKSVPEDNKGYVLDFRDAKLHIHYKEYTKIIAYVKRNLEKFGHKKMAIITKDASDIVIPLLVRENFKGFNTKPFGSPGAAITWVLNRAD